MKAGRELDALVVEKVVGLSVLGMAFAGNYDGEWMVSTSPVDGDNPNRENAHPVYLKECRCQTFSEMDKEFNAKQPDLEWNEPKIFGHTTFCLEVVPFYSTNVADAWQVVEKLAEQTKWWEMARRPFADGRGAKVNFMGDPFYDVYAETVPLAICLAALKAVGVSREATK